MPSTADYEQLINKLVANGFSSPGLTVLQNGVVGYDVLFVGYSFYVGGKDNWQGDDKKDMGYWTSDGDYVAVSTDGRFAVMKGPFNDLRLCVRLIKE